MTSWKGKLQTYNLQISSFSRFWVKIPGFYHFLSKFQENDKIPGFQGFLGRVGTLSVNNIADRQRLYLFFKLHTGMLFNQNILLALKLLL